MKKASLLTFLICIGNLLFAEIVRVVKTSCFENAEQSSISSITIIDNTSCAQQCGNGNIEILVQGGVPPYVYSINPSCGNTLISPPLISNLPGGSYTVSIEDSSGFIIDTLITIADPVPIILTTSNINPTPGNIDGTLSATATGGTPPYDYLWLPNNCNAPTCNNVGGGNYTLTVVDAQGCNASISAVLSYPTGISTLNISDAMIIYPNPATDYLYLQAQQNIGAISILNSLGQEVWKQHNIATREHTINIQSLSEGVYTLRRSNGVYKFVLKR